MEKLLGVDSVRKTFGGLVALSDVSLEVNEGTIVGLIGPNGSGKTTLLNVLTGVLKPNGGRAHFRGQNITGKSPQAIARLGIGRTFQIPRVFSNLTVKENILAVLNDRSETRIVSDLLQTLNLNQVEGVKAGQLGYSDKKQVELARVMALEPTLVMLDEPMAGLDLEMVSSMSSYIRRIKESQGKTILIVEHNLEELLSIADYVIVLDHGSLLYQGTPQEIKNSTAVTTAYFGA